MRTFTIILIALFGPGLAAQEEKAVQSEPAADRQEIAGLAPGDRFLIKRSKERLGQQATQTMLLSRSTSTIELEVLKKLENGGRRLRWTLTSNDIQAQGDAALQTVLLELGRRTKGKFFDFDLDAEGKPTGLVDPQAVMTSYGELIDELSAWMREKGIQEQVATSILAGIRGFTDEKTVVDLSLRDVRIVFYRPSPLPKPGGKIERTAEIANPFDPENGEPVPSRISTRWEQPAPDETWLVHEEGLDFEAAKPMLRAAIETRALAQGQALPQDFTIPRLEAGEKFALCGIASRIPDRVVVERRRFQGQNGQIDRDIYLIERQVTEKPTSRPEKD